MLHTLPYWPPAASLANECQSGVHPQLDVRSARELCQNRVRIGIVGHTAREGLRLQPDTFGLEDTMAGLRVGYVRVSTFDQRTDRQLDGVELDRVFTDKASGKDVVRPQLDALLAFVSGTATPSSCTRWTGWRAISTIFGGWCGR